MKNRKRLSFLIVVIVIVLCLSSTVLAVSYGKEFLTSGTYSYSNYMGHKGVILDANTRCYFQSGAGEYNTVYSSRGYAKIIGTSSWTRFSSEPNASGQNAWHNYNRDDYADGKLGFYNTQHPGYWCVATGNVYIEQRD